MSFKDGLKSLSHDTGYEAFQDVLGMCEAHEDDEQALETISRLHETISSYPVLRGMLDAFLDSARADLSSGADPVGVEKAVFGFTAAVGTIALIGESDLTDI